jgi:hypothetical protein
MAHYNVWLVFEYQSDDGETYEDLEIGMPFKIAQGDSAEEIVHNTIAALTPSDVTLEMVGTFDGLVSEITELTAEIEG